jgi:3-dehydroquinate synthase
LELETQRSSFILGIGGGIVCDITGFVASTYLRGVRFGFVSTTLLSQVDASVGGKNGVNFEGYKNMVGVFNQPEFVICDMELLRTLPENELVNGFGEIVKHAAIGDKNMFAYIEAQCMKKLWP